MTISEQIELLQTLMDILDTVGGFVIIFGIGFLITGGGLGKLFAYKMNLDIMKYGVPVKGLSISDLVVSLAKHGYTCNQVGDDTISVYNPRNPKAGTIIYSYTNVDGEYYVMKLESRTDYFATMYSAIMPMLDIYNETIYSVETKTTLTGADDEDFGKLVRKVSNGTAKKSAILCIVLGIATMLSAVAIGFWGDNHYNQFSVKLQKGIEDAVGAGSTDVSDYSYDDEDDSDDTDDDDEKDAPVTTADTSDDTDDDETYNDYSSANTTTSATSTSTGKYIDLNDLFTCLIVDENGCIDPAATSEAITNDLGISCQYDNMANSITSDDGSLCILVFSDVITVSFSECDTCEYNVFGVRLGTTNFYDVENLYPNVVSNELDATNITFSYNEDGTAEGTCRPYNSYDMKVTYDADQNETVNRVSFTLYY